MTSSEIRQSFLDFFREKEHTIVPSSSLMPDSPNLLFTNAGMNQFVPIFLGQTPCPYSPTRAADTQKCIRAGGKHNDLEDVGFDTYHHTFFEMLGNWSFGNYFKKEAIDWAWELVVGRWNFPASRLYATVYQPGPGDPASFDQEAYDFWAKIFTKAGLDPAVHIVRGNKKDNFWMMGDTGPCGPCSELHVNLLPGPRDPDLEGQKAGRELVNSGDARCIEIWNLVFIQFNANPGGAFSDLPAKHVDTGMGFERVTSMIQGTNGLVDFSRTGDISNYNTDVFRPIFDEIEKITGKTYKSTLPKSAQNLTEDEKIDVAFRVIADHVRTLSFSIADGILPGNTDRNYVLRRILRRAVKYGRNLGLKEPFLAKLVDVLGKTMGHVFPEVVAKADLIKKTLTNEEESFFRTLDRGIELFEGCLDGLEVVRSFVLSVPEKRQRLEGFFGKDAWSLEKSDGQQQSFLELARSMVRFPVDFDPVHYGGLTRDLRDKSATNRRQIACREFIAEWQARWNGVTEGFSTACEDWVSTGYSADFFAEYSHRFLDALARIEVEQKKIKAKLDVFSGADAFRLYDTYGFPLDLTELMARESGMVIDVVEFSRLMEKQRLRSQSAQQKQVIAVAAVAASGDRATKFVGFEDKNLSYSSVIEEVDEGDNYLAFSSQETPFYATMGGQVSDTGRAKFQGKELEVVDVQKNEKGIFWHVYKTAEPIELKATFGIKLEVDEPRRGRIEAHHSGTHVMHWALRKVLGTTVSQKGSYVGPDRLRFDFSHGAALSPAELSEIDKLVNDQIAANVPVSWEERPYSEVKGDPSILQFFGDKYGEKVRVVSIGDFSKELCGGTHVRESGKIGYFKIVSEGAIAAGVRRIEAVSGPALVEFVNEAFDKQDAQYAQLKLRKPDLAPLNTLAREQSTQALWELYIERENALKAANAAVAQHEKDSAKAQEATFQKRAGETAPDLIGAAQDINGVPFLSVQVEDAPAAYLPFLADAIKSRWQGVAVLGTAADGKVSLLAAVAPAHTKKVQAGKIIQTIAPLVGGKGGGRPELAQGGGTHPAGLASALAKAEEFVRSL